MSDELKRYEALIVLNSRGEDGIDEMISAVGREMEEEGVKLDKIDKLGKRDFAYNARHQAGGYYVNYFFEATPSAIEKVEQRLKLNGDIYLQQYLRQN